MLASIEKTKGVFYITEKHENYADSYLNVREKEERIYEDDIVALLPNVSKTHRYYQEWKLRQQSTNRILDYLKQKKKSLKILDLGCGNGWFSHHLSKVSNTEVFAVDLNAPELEQAARVFQKDNLHFLYADIFSEEAEKLNEFDIITVNSCIQYFRDLKTIVEVLKKKLVLEGELHIIDSPFYTASEIHSAKERTKTYYSNIGVPEMASHYFHHSLTSINNYELLYEPKRSILSKITRKKENPFCWVKIKK